MIRCAIKGLIYDQNLSKKIISSIISFSLIYGQITLSCQAASNIIPDGSTNTTIDHAQNGVIVVNVAQPTNAGVSHNRYNDFNVDKSGAILNNATNIGNSQLGGALYANPNFGAGPSADILLNEVTSKNQSQLQGMLEVFGKKAEVIIANPNGITCQGCGFINTSRLGLVAGKPLMDSNGQIQGYNLENPDLQSLAKVRLIGDADNQYIALNANNVNYVDIISNIVELSGSLLAKEQINIQTGDKNYDRLSDKITSKSDKQINGLAIDAKNLGAMQAGKIEIIATQKGFGVNMLGKNIARSNQLTVNTDGDIIYRDLIAATDVNVASNNGSTSQFGKIQAGGEINLTAAHDIYFNPGTSVFSQANTSIAANDSIINRGGNILSLGDLYIGGINDKNAAEFVNAVTGLNSIYTKTNNYAIDPEPINTNTNPDNSNLTKIARVESLGNMTINADLISNLGRDRFEEPYYSTTLHRSFSIHGEDDYGLDSDFLVYQRFNDISYQSYLRFSPLHNWWGGMKTFLADVSGPIMVFYGIKRLDPPLASNRSEFNKRELDSASNGKWIINDPVIKDNVIGDLEFVLDIPRSTLTSDLARIISNKNLNTKNTNLNNQAGQIYAADNMNVNGNTNNQISNFELSGLKKGWFELKNGNHSYKPIPSSWDAQIDDCYYNYYNGCVTASNFTINNNYYSTTLSSTTPSIISSGKDLTITGERLGNNAFVTGNNPDSTYLNSDLQNLAKNGVIDAKKYVEQALGSGLFDFDDTKIPQPEYLTETNPNYTNLNSFIASSYFFSRIGFKPETIPGLSLGNGFFETRIINDALRDAGIKTGPGSNSEMIKKMYDNAISNYQKLASKSNGIELTPGIRLSQQQVDLLTDDIIWPVEEVINGKKIMIPQIYLAKASRNKIGQYATNLKGGVIDAGGSLTMDLSEQFYNQANINSGQNLKITASQIDNIGGTISAAGNAELNATSGSVNLVSTIGGYQSKTAKGTTTRQWIDSLSTVKSGGKLSLNSAADINILASNLSSGDDMSLKSDGAINIATIELTNSYQKNDQGDGNNSSRTTKTNWGSSLQAHGNFSMEALLDVNVMGSDIAAKGSGNIKSEFGNINIKNAVDSLEAKDSKKGGNFFRSSFDEVYDYREAARESSLNFGGDLAFAADAGKLAIQGSSLKTVGDLKIGDFTIAKNEDGSYKQNSDKTYVTVDGSTVNGVEISAANLKFEHSEKHQTSGFNLLGAISFGLLAPIYSSQDQKESSTGQLQYSSNLDIGGNIMINSKNNVDIIASNVSTDKSLLLNIEGDLNIKSAANNNSDSRAKNEMKLGELTADLDLLHASLSVGMKGSGSSFESTANATNQKGSNINVKGSVFANLTSGKNGNGDLNLVASDLIVNQNALIRAASSVNIVDAQNEVSNSSKTSSLEIEAGVKVGNAYVDAAHAWVAVGKAAENLKKTEEKRQKIEQLYKEGKASKKALDLATAQVALASAAIASSTVSASAATASAGAGAQSNFGTGFYVGGYANAKAEGIKNSNTSSTSVGSKFIVVGDLDINANQDFNMIGSVVDSNNGNITIAANKINIEAGTNNIEQSSKQETVYGGVTVSTSGGQVNAGYSQGQSAYSKTYYTNSTLNAKNGKINLTSKNDTNIHGANINYQDLTLETGGDLNISSKQTTESYVDNGFGINGSVGFVSSGVNSASVGFNLSNGNENSNWTENQTILQGQKTTIRTGLNKESGTKGDFNLIGAAIISENSQYEIAGNTNKKDLQDSYNSENFGLGFTSNISFAGNGDKVKIGGSTNISVNYSQKQKERTTYAVTGNSNSALTSATKETLGADFSTNFNVDHRLFSQDGQKEIFRELNYSKDLVATPVESLIESASQADKGGTNLADSLASKYTSLNQMMFNPELTAQDLTPEAENLIAYEGRVLEEGVDAKNAQGFYDRSENILAVNIDTNQKDSETAGTLAHENYHAQKDNQNQIYSLTEENTAHNIGNFVENRWDTYQADNNDFRLSVPAPTLYGNSYANNTQFGEDINPSTFVEEIARGKYRIVSVDTKDEDLGVYVVNKSDSQNKDIKLGETEFIDEFANFKSYKEPVIHTDIEIDIDGMSNAIVGNEDKYDIPIDPMKRHMISEFKNNGAYDLKESLKGNHGIKTHLDGVWINGKITSIESAGNQLAGQALYKGFGQSKTLITAGTGLYHIQAHNLDLLKELKPPYYGETEYAGRMIQIGVNRAKNSDYFSKMLNSPSFKSDKELINRYIYELTPPIILN